MKTTMPKPIIHPPLDPCRASDAEKPGPSPLGLYSRYFTPAERELLAFFAEEDGLSEVNLLRVLLARTVAASRRRAVLDPKLHAALLSAFSRAAANIAGLVRLRHERLAPFEDLVLEALAAMDPDDL